jgi:thioredoxin 1
MVAVGRGHTADQTETESMMATRNLTAAEFADVASGDGIVLIDFWAAWCGPCVRFAPVYERVSDKHPDVVFAKVDTEAEPALSQEFQIRSIPTLMAIRDGVISSSAKAGRR